MFYTLETRPELPSRIYNRLQSLTLLNNFSPTFTVDSGSPFPHPNTSRATEGSWYVAVGPGNRGGVADHSRAIVVQREGPPDTFFPL